MMLVIFLGLMHGFKIAHFIGLMGFSMGKIVQLDQSMR
jgi:hypothetical protein